MITVVRKPSCEYGLGSRPAGGDIAGVNAGAVAEAIVTTKDCSMTKKCKKTFQSNPLKATQISKDASGACATDNYLSNYVAA